MAALPTGRMKRELGLWGLTAMGITGVVGSGWLFAAFFAAKLAGPAAVVAWLIGGGLMVLTGLCFAEVATAYPLSGGGAQLATATHGRTIGLVSMWLLYLGYVSTPAIEAAAIIDYTGSYFPSLVEESGAVLSWKGRGVAVGVAWVFVVLNFFSIRWFNRLNSTLTWWKFAIPLLVVGLLLLERFEWSNFGWDQPAGSPQSFMPMGWGGVLAALSAGGVVFSLSGFRIVADMAEEAANPGRDIPRAFGIAILFATGLYVLVQGAFIGALDPSSHADGWASLGFSGDSAPLVTLLKLAGIAWLANVLYVDAVISPGGSCLAYTAATARVGYAVSNAGYAPRLFSQINGKGVPFMSLLACAGISTLLIALYPAWDQLAALNAAAYFLSVAPVAVVLLALRKIDPDGRRPFRLPFAPLVAWAAFASNALIVSWCGPKAVVPTAAAALLAILGDHFHARRATNDRVPDHWSQWGWMVLLLVVVGAVSLVGDPAVGGYGWLPAPWDSFLTASAATGALWWAWKGRSSSREARQALSEIRTRVSASMEQSGRSAQRA